MDFIKRILIAGLVLLAGIAQGQTFAYMPERGNASPELDAYSFAGARGAPVMVYVHGGAWMIGDKRRVEDKPAFFNQNGYVFISLNYTLVPETTVESQLAELDSALGFIADNVARIGGDPRNISLMGHSAGAHLVSMMALRPLENAQALLAQGALRAVLSIDTRAYDISRIAAQAGGSLPRAYRRPFGNDPARWAALSPQSYIGETEKNLPAFFVAWSGAGDNAVRASFGQDFARRLQGVGTAVTTFDGGEYSHGGINKGIGKSPAISNAISQFLTAQL